MIKAVCFPNPCMPDCLCALALNIYAMSGYVLMQPVDNILTQDAASKRIDGSLHWAGLSVLALMAIVQIFPPNYGSGPAILTGTFSIGVVGAAWLSLGRAKTSLCTGVLLAGLLLGFYIFAGSVYVWPLHLLLPLIATHLLVRKAAENKVPEYLSCGGYGWPGFALTFVSALAVAITLLAWLHFTQPDLSDARVMLPRSPSALIFSGIGFSIVNAILEEAVWRGVLLHWLKQRFTPILAVVLQAVSFGAAHWNGFPNGLAGSLLASIFGIGLGLAALRCRGLAAVTATHALVDAVIFTILASSTF
ncbi:CPBP family intramembrane glutamic endopeptidase [Sphingobium yanoikuyae]|nr:CPBP family intramembrane metalloprotease [Sphingobium yanoikuyae]